MKISVLAIDDSRTMRDMLRAALVRAGFDVRTAEDGVDGTNALDSYTPDVIITDINMPNMDGFGVIQAVRARPDTQTLPVLVLTTESAADLKARARDAGATGWIVKPFDEAKLVAAIRRVAV